MAWNVEAKNRIKIKELKLKFALEDYEKLKKIKDHKDMTWEDAFFYAMVNLKVKK